MSACFAAGTRILTARGEVAVETLTQGDLAVGLRRGKLSQILRIGAHELDLRAHPDPESVTPIRVCADGFGPGRPNRDLVLSPDHALYIDGHLIPVRTLLNGATIRQERPDWITYYTVALYHHDVLLANGLTAESLHDTSMVDPQTMPTDVARAPGMSGACAPHLPKGEAFVALRQALFDRAVALGHVVTADPALRVMAGHRRIWPKPVPGGVRFQLPSGPGRVRIVSRSFVPQEMGAVDADGRRLGVGITSIRLDGREVALAGDRLESGWHEPEQGLRWTNGTAWLRTGVARSLVFTLFEGATYWTHAETAANAPPSQAVLPAWATEGAGEEGGRSFRSRLRRILASLHNVLTPLPFKTFHNV